MELAVANALAALGAESVEDISYEIEDLGSRGIFGIGARPCKVKAWIDLPDTIAPRQHGATAPKRESAPESTGKAENTEKTEKTENKGERRNNSRRRNRGGRGESRPPRDFVAPEEPAKLREAVIPEAELKMEPVTAQEGEDLAFDFVNKLIENLGINATASLFHCEDGSRRIAINGEGASVLIGHHGEALDSLQYLANLAGSRKNAEGERNRRRVTIDIEGYRAKREETLRALARKMAAKALRNHRNVMLEPMSAYERRIIHSEVQGIEGVSTNSIGSDNNRKIVIYLTNEKKAEKEIAADEIEAPASVCEDTEDATL